MARLTFGGDDVVLNTAGVAAAGQFGFAWTAETGGTAMTDLQDMAGVALPLGKLTSGAGGKIPPFKGPDSAVSMWLDFGGPRFYTSAHIEDILASNVGGNVYRLLATGAPLAYSLTGVPSRVAVPFRDYVGTLDPTSGAFGFDSTADSWNGRPYSFATSLFLPADRAWLDLFDRTTPLDQTTFVYSAGALTKPWAPQPYVPAPVYFNPSIILNAGDAVPSGFTTGVVCSNPSPYRNIRT